MNCWGLINSRGNEVVSYTYKSIEVFTKSLAKLVNQYGHYGIIDMQGVLKNTLHIPRLLKMILTHSIRNALFYGNT